MSNHHYVFLGPQGSGKGTQAEHLAAHFGIAHISTGHILRHEVANNTKRGGVVAESMKTGSLVPDDMANEVIKEQLMLPTASAGFVLDGYPRTLPQAKFLETQDTIDRVILLELPDEEVFARIRGRLTCDGCGHMYHVTNRPSKVVGVCDQCGGRVYQREDDTDEAIQHRLELYHRLTEPLIEYYEAQGILLRVDAHPPIQEVSQTIIKALEL